MIVVYYGVNLSLVPCRLSISLHAFLFVSLPLFILPSRFPLLPASLSLNLASPHLLLPTLPLLFPSSPFGQTRLSFSSGLCFSAPDVPPVANIVFLPPPRDMAKEAICALLAILGHFFEAFSHLDLFFAPSPFRPVPRPFPAFVHLGFRRLVSPRSRARPPLPALASPCPPMPAPRRAHQAPFYARGLLKIIAVSENAPGAHGDVPRAQGVPRARSIP